MPMSMMGVREMLMGVRDRIVMMNVAMPSAGSNGRGV